MTYPKEFFLVWTILLALALVLLGSLLDHQLPPWALPGWWFVAICVGAVTGRGSIGLADRFAKLVGRLVLTPIGISMARSALGRNICLEPEGQVAPGTRATGYVDYAYDKVLEQIKRRGIAVSELQIDTKDFRAYLAAARYQDYHPDYYRSTPEYLVRKQVQHYVSTLITPAEGNVVWMDVASSTSPFPEILQRLYRIKVFSQDLSYPAGVDGLRIGSDACAVPLPDSSVDRISLHCSFEHFEGDADSRFIPELARLLSPGGSAAIIPLYVSDVYQILTNPYYWLKRGLPEEAGCQVIASSTYWESHGRFYDWAALEARVIRPLEATKLKYEFIRVTVPHGVDYPPFLVLKVIKLPRD